MNETILEHIADVVGHYSVRPTLIRLSREDYGHIVSEHAKQQQRLVVAGGSVMRPLGDFNVLGCPVEVDETLEPGMFELE